MEAHLASWCAGPDGGAEPGRQEVRGGGLRVRRLLRGHRGRYELIRSKSEVLEYLSSTESFRGIYCAIRSFPPLPLLRFIFFPYKF